MKYNFAGYLVYHGTKVAAYCPTRDEALKLCITNNLDQSGITQIYKTTEFITEPHIKFDGIYEPDDQGIIRPTTEERIV